MEFRHELGYLVDLILGWQDSGSEVECALLLAESGSGNDNKGSGKANWRNANPQGSYSKGLEKGGPE